MSERLKVVQKYVMPFIDFNICHRMAPVDAAFRHFDLHFKVKHSIRMHLQQKLRNSS